MDIPSTKPSPHDEKEAPERGCNAPERPTNGEEKALQEICAGGIEPVEPRTQHTTTQKIGLKNEHADDDETLDDLVHQRSFETGSENGINQPEEALNKELQHLNGAMACDQSRCWPVAHEKDGGGVEDSESVKVSDGDDQVNTNMRAHFPCILDYMVIHDLSPDALTFVLVRSSCRSM